MNYQNWKINPNNPRNISVSDGIDIEVWAKEGDLAEANRVARLIQKLPRMYALLERMKEIEETIGDTIQAHREYRKCAYRADDLIRELQSAGLKTEASE